MCISKSQLQRIFQSVHDIDAFLIFRFILMDNWHSEIFISLTHACTIIVVYVCRNNRFHPRECFHFAQYPCHLLRDHFSFNRFYFVLQYYELNCYLMETTATCLTSRNAINYMYTFYIKDVINIIINIMMKQPLSLAIF